MQIRTVADEIREKVPDFFVNRNGVRIQNHYDCPFGEFEIIFESPKFERTNLTFCYYIYYKTAEAFASDFVIFEVEQLDEIGREDLISRFESGGAGIFCSVGDDDYLRFKKDGALLYAEDCVGKRHLVWSPLVTVKHYFIYTAEYVTKRH